MDEIIQIVQNGTILWPAPMAMINLTLGGTL